MDFIISNINIAYLVIMVQLKYIFSDVVVKIKQNECWLLTTFNENVSLGSSIKVLNNYLDFNHGKQIIIRENNKFIWTI